MAAQLIKSTEQEFGKYVPRSRVVYKQYRDIRANWRKAEKYFGMTYPELDVFYYKFIENDKTYVRWWVELPEIPIDLNARAFDYLENSFTPEQ